MSWLRKIIMSQALSFLDKLPLQGFKTLIGAVMLIVSFALNLVPAPVAEILNVVMEKLLNLGYTIPAEPTPEAFWAAMGVVIIGLVAKVRRLLTSGKSESK